MERTKSRCEPVQGASVEYRSVQKAISSPESPKRNRIYHAAQHARCSSRPDARLPTFTLRNLLWTVSSICKLPRSLKSTQREWVADLNALEISP